MKTLSAEVFSDLSRDVEVLARGSCGPKVFRHADGRIYKLLSARPRWRLGGRATKVDRFQRNARRLAGRGFACPEVVDVLFVPHLDRHLLVYRPVPGESLRSVLADSAERDDLRSRLARTMARLHRNGIYFGAGHLGNYIVSEGEELGLIDVHELWISPLPLGPYNRARSFRILLKTSRDRDLLAQDGRASTFLDTYIREAGLGPIGRTLLRAAFRLKYPRLAAAG